MIIGYRLSGEDVLIWDAEAAIRLRREHRIVGALIGALPTQPRQSNYMGLPLKLSPEETSLLLHKRLIEVKDGLASFSPVVCIHTADTSADASIKSDDTDIDTSVSTITDTDTRTDSLSWNWPNTDQEKLRYRIFFDLWHRGYYITSGLKYGGDYLVYTGDPAIVHSHFIAKILSWNESISPLTLVNDGRLGGKVKKNMLYCTVNPTNDTVQYLTLSWSGIS